MSLADRLEALAGKVTAMHPIADWLDDRLAERFWKYVERRGPNDCWPWSGQMMTKNSRGYLRVYIDGKAKNVLCSRISFTLHKGPIPDGLFVCHTCDNPNCVNPDHLWAGTVTDNCRDMWRKGRQSPPPKSRVRTHCRRGHEFTPENTSKTATGRTCQTCKLDAMRRWRASRRKPEIIAALRKDATE
jgi:hypothetical protein